MEEEDFIDVSKLKCKSIQEVQTLDIFKPFERVSKLLLSNFNEQQDFNSIFEELKTLIDQKAVSLEFIAYALEKSSEIKEKKLNLFAVLYAVFNDIYGFKINVRTDNFRCLLAKLGIPFDCSVYGEPEELKTVYCKDTPFYFAAYDLIEELQNIDNFDDSKDDLSLLDIACKFGSEKCFRFLRVNGIKYSDETDKLSIMGGNFEILSILTNEGHSFGKYLDIAIKYNHNEIADWIMSTFDAYQLNIGDPFIWINFQAASFLIENGYNLNCSALESGWQTFKCPLALAIEWNSLDIVKYMVENGADPNFSFEVLYEVWDEMYDVHASKTPFLTAVLHKHTEIIKYLLDHGADVNTKLDDYRRNGGWEYFDAFPLSIAIDNEDTDTIQLLCEYGANVNMKLKYDGWAYEHWEYRSPLIQAIDMENPEMVQLLIKNGAKIDLDLSNDVVKIHISKTENGYEVNKTVGSSDQHTPIY